VRSIEAMRSAFLDLIERQPIDQIAIRDITQAAGLSYPTFFRRYANKEELLETIAADEVRALLRLGEKDLQGLHDGLPGAAMCAYVQQRRRLWATLLNGGAASAMRNEFMRIANEIASARPRANPWLPLELAVTFVTAGIFELFAWWLRQPEDYPVENVVKLFNALIIDSAGRPRNISLV
jgi:AcrR family transcriptional regulator